MKNHRITRLVLVAIVAVGVALQPAAASANTWGGCGLTTRDGIGYDDSFYVLYAYNTSLTKIAPVNFYARAVLVKKDPATGANHWFYGTDKINAYYNLPQYGGTLNVSYASSTFGVGYNASYYHRFRKQDGSMKVLTPDRNTCMW